MGSHPSPPPPPQPSHHIYVAFCSKESDRNSNFSNWIARFDPFHNMWSFSSSIPRLTENQVLRDFAMVSIGELIYIIGGRLCCRGNFGSSTQRFETEVRIRPEVLCYNVNSGHWSNCAPLSLPRYNFGCTVCDNKIYVAGGQHELASARSTSSVEVYDPSTNEWTILPDLRRSRYKCVAVTWQRKVHVIGGFVDGCDVNPLIAYVGRCSAEVYDEQRGRWDLVEGMWQLDVPPNQIVAVEDRVFSSGDCLNAWKGHIEVYDGKLNLWNVVEGSQMKSLGFGGGEENWQRLYVTMAAIGPHLYFLASYKSVTSDVSSSTISIVHRFDTSATENAWTSFDPMQEKGEREIHSHCCVVSHSN